MKFRFSTTGPIKRAEKYSDHLVPYGKVWRTGANEATTFETNKDLLIEGKPSRRESTPSGPYPGEETWTIIFNSEYGQWGIGPDGEANRNPERDVLSINVHAVQSQSEFEQFTISFEKVGEDAEMVLIWDKTLVAVPFSF